MPFLFEYILKLSLSLGVVFMFYHFVLRRLTFYNWNRWYLLGYTILCFFLPFIDISIALEQSAIKDNAVISWVPVLGQPFIKDPRETGLYSLGTWDYAGLVLLSGILIMLFRLCFQLWSIRRMRRKAVLLSEDGMRLYQVDAAIIPFSFGNSIFINKDQHNVAELEEIIRHEFVHVKQKHSVDIIWGELLCLLNWYNPFAWLLKKGIRQNLEFIADRQVLEQGMDRKQYQYLLLKVIGNNHFSIANQFNFSSLKKRIAMMNKIRSARFHLVKFLFILPLVSVLLLAFRNDWKKHNAGRSDFRNSMTFAGTDTIPEKRLAPPPPPAVPGNPMNAFLKKNPDVKDVSWAFKDNEEAAIIFIHLKNGKIEEYDIREKAVKEKLIAKYGSLPFPPPPPPAAPGAIVVQGYPISPAEPAEVVSVKGYPIAPASPKEAVTVQGYPIAPASPNEIVSIEMHPLPAVSPREVAEVRDYPPPPPPARLPENVKSIRITKDNKAEVQLKNGKTEKYDLNNPNEKGKFDAKYPAPPPPPPPPPAKTVVVEGYKLNGSAAVAGKPLPDNLIYVIDGIITTKYEMEKISPEKIASVDILKGNSAVALYGENAWEGVVQIKLKYDAQPLYVIDGEISAREAVDKIKPEQIVSVDVLKGEKATGAYGEKGKNGVVVIHTKK